MKRRMHEIIIAAVAGGLAGWIGARTIIRPALTEQDRIEIAAPESPEKAGSRWTNYLETNAPRESADDAEGFLAAREAEANEVGNPFRFTLRSLDRLESLSINDLTDLLEKGLLTDSVEVGAAIRRLATEDPAATLGRLIVGQFLLSREADQRAREQTISIWAESDPAGALAFIDALDANNTRAALAASLARAWTEADPQAAAEHFTKLERLAGSVRGQRIANDIFTKWAHQNAAQAEAWIRNQAPPERRRDLLDLVLLARAEQISTDAAINLILANPESEALQASLAERWRSWAMEDPQSAVEKFIDLPADHPMQHHVGSIAQTELAVTRDLQTALKRAEQLPEGFVRRKYVQGLVNFGASNDIDLALEALPHLPESREREEAMGMLTELWMRQDPEALSRWLAELKPSPSRDAAVARFADLLRDSDPEAAEAWAETL